MFGDKDRKRKEQQRQQQQRLAAAGEEEDNQQWRAKEEQAPLPKKDTEKTRKDWNEPNKDRDELPSHPDGDSQESLRSAKRKLRALRSWWRRFVAKAGIWGTKKVKRDGVVDAKARLVEELRKRLEQHPEELWARAKAVLHELDDNMLLRYSIYCFVVKHDNSRYAPIDLWPGAYDLHTLLRVFFSPILYRAGQAATITLMVVVTWPGGCGSALEIFNIFGCEKQPKRYVQLLHGPTGYGRASCSCGLLSCAPTCACTSTR